MKIEPTRPRLIHAVAVSVVAPLTLLSGCGGGSQATTGASAASKGAPEEFGLSLAQLSTRIEETETLIATCMRDAGFEYTALDFAAVKRAMDSDQTAPGVSDEDYIAQFGLGITTQFDKPLIVFGAGPQNTAFLDGLGEADRAAYRRALWGEASEWNHVRALEEEDFSQTGGCTRTAAERLYTPGEFSSSYVNPADAKVEQDPRMVAAFKKWSQCMAAEGFQYDHPDRVGEDLKERLAVITQGADPRALTGAALAELQELQGEERAIAAVLTTCEEDHIEDVQRQVEADVFGGSPT